ncbi:MAG: hypothetical protein JEZ11_07300 [Desulfobacterales bacterium]|nr:hypothetical protein [Desulfobacterales bacterium]
MAMAQLVISTAEGALSAWIEDVVSPPSGGAEGSAPACWGLWPSGPRRPGATRLQLLAGSERPYI